MTLYSLDGQDVKTPDEGACWIAPGASVLGNVHIGRDTSIWFGAVVRGDNDSIVIGERSNIQDGCVLHVDAGFPLTVGNDCTIGHLAMLHGCTIEDGALIGIGAIVLNGAVIGAGSLIGAGALVPEGKVIPPRSLVMGTPGKIIRDVSDAEKLRMDEGAAGYCQRWRQFASKLQPQNAQHS